MKTVSRFLSGAQLEQRAFEIMHKAHQGATYGGGEFWRHPLSVANTARMRGHGSLVIASCLLHDTVEDSDVSLATLLEQGIPPIVVIAVDGVTFLGSDPIEKITKARSNDMSHVTKHCDSTRNHQQCVDDHDERVERYTYYLSMLDPGLPDRHQIQRYIDDFARSPDDLLSESYSIETAKNNSATINPHLDQRLSQLTRVVTAKSRLDEILQDN